jgi:hypothetical protein
LLIASSWPSKALRVCSADAICSFKIAAMRFCSGSGGRRSSIDFKTVAEATFLIAAPEVFLKYSFCISLVSSINFKNM